MKSPCWLLGIAISTLFVMAITLCFLDLYYCQQHFESKIDKAACFAGRFAMDVDEAYQGRSIERFIVPIVAGLVYIAGVVMVNTRCRALKSPGYAPV